MIIDRSGSMEVIKSDMNPAINSFLAEQDKEPGDILVDVTLFDTEVEFPFNDVLPSDIGADLIRPRGFTALNDAIGITIKRLGAKLALMPEADRPEHVIVVTCTDGMENSSREYTAAQVKEMVEEQTNQWNWTFIFMAANIDAFAVGRDYGFRPGQTMNYEASAAGATNSFAAASRLSKSTRSGLDASFTDEDREEAMKA
jgi:hypothetical protein